MTRGGPPWGKWKVHRQMYGNCTEEALGTSARGEQEESVPSFFFTLLRCVGRIAAEMGRLIWNLSTGPDLADVSSADFISGRLVLPRLGIATTVMRVSVESGRTWR